MPVSSLGFSAKIDVQQSRPVIAFMVSMWHTAPSFNPIRCCGRPSGDHYGGLLAWFDGLVSTVPCDEWSVWPDVSFRCRCCGHCDGI